MDSYAKMEKAAVNHGRPEMFSPEQVHELMEHAGKDWRVVWEELPTDALFDQLYALAGRWEVFIYQSTLFERKVEDPQELMARFYWETDSGDDSVLEWIIEHPPFECCVPIADLYQYGRNLNPETSPWLLFELIAGYKHANDPWDAHDLLPIGGNDASYVGNALVQWGTHADVIEPFIQLISRFSLDE